VQQLAAVQAQSGSGDCSGLVVLDRLLGAGCQLQGIPNMHVQRHLLCKHLHGV
jgi:hypothetical protein